MRTELEAAGRRWLTGGRGRRRLRALRALCDMYIPAVRPPEGAGPMGGFWLRTASDLQTELAVAGWIETRLAAADRDGIVRLLDLLAVVRFHRWPRPVQSRVVALPPRTSELARGFRGLREMAFGMFYALPLAGGGNPSWPVVGYPGPPQLAVPAPRITPLRPAGDELRLDADVVVVGSGSGGSVIAAELAGQGLDVVVLEAGGHYEPSNYPIEEPAAYDAMYWRGGFTSSDDRNLLIAAGATLGGGSTVNWSNCVTPPDRLRDEWAQLGLKDLATAAFDEHVAAVRERLSVNADCSQRNGPNERLVGGAEALGWSWRCADRNSDPSAYDYATAGYLAFGDRTGAKQSTAVTYLPDAVASGARLLVDTRAVRIRTHNGAAAGVDAEMVHDGRRVPVTLNAPTVVVAGGALETPALLLRSGLGGPAVGRNLHVHPTFGIVGYYRDEQEPWLGAPHTVIVDEFADLAQGHGFLLEGIPFAPGFSAAGLPPQGGRTHKMMMGRSGRTAVWIGLVRDRGSGRVTLGPDGEAFVTYPFDDDLDQRHLRAALDAMLRCHEAAGARAVFDTQIGRVRYWRRGQPLRPFVDAACDVPFRLPYRTLATAHQMGTARMGTDPRASVADPEGQLHDTPGVWIGDTSAFPTASGVNPMITAMALARRTAAAIAAARA